MIQTIPAPALEYGKDLSPAALVDRANENQMARTANSLIEIERDKVYEPILCLLHQAGRSGFGGSYYDASPEEELANLQAAHILISERLDFLADKASRLSGASPSEGVVSPQLAHSPCKSSGSPESPGQSCPSALSQPQSPCEAGDSSECSLESTLSAKLDPENQNSQSSSSSSLSSGLTSPGFDEAGNSSAEGEGA